MGKRLLQTREARDKFVASASREARKDLAAVSKALAATVTPARVNSAIEHMGPDHEWLQETAAIWQAWGRDELSPWLGEVINKQGANVMRDVTAAVKGLFYFGEKARFNSTTRRLLAWIEKEAGNLVQDISTEQQASLRRTMSLVAKREFSTGAAVDRIKGVIDLTARESGWVDTFEESLAGDANAARKVERYRDMLRTLRAERISRTEAGRAYMESGQETMRQAVDSGLVSRVVKIWRTVGDDRVRDEHADMEGQERELSPNNEPYSNGEMYPGENSINCRCYEQHELQGG
jgi:Phage Mu protein F like protein